MGALLRGNGQVNAAGGYFDASAIDNSIGSGRLLYTLLNPAQPAGGQGQLAEFTIGCKALGASGLGIPAVLLSDPEGQELASGIAPASGTPLLLECSNAIPTNGCGDVHPAAGGDGDIDVFDALRTLKMSVGVVVPTSSEQTAADVHPDNDPDPDGDGDIDVLDALRNLKAAVDLVTITSCGGPVQ